MKLRVLGIKVIISRTIRIITLNWIAFLQKYRKWLK